MVVPPIRPTIIGSTTVSANWAATAASMALPPAASISMPAAEASGWFVTTMPRVPWAGCFSQVNGVPARSRQFDLPMAYPPVLCDRWKRDSTLDAAGIGRDSSTDQG